MGIISKITPQQDTNQLGGKPVRITKFKNGEILAYNSVSKQWEAIANPTLAEVIDSTTAKTPLVDTDTFALTEPTTLKKTLWSTIKSTLKTYFDGLYLSLTGGTLTGGLTITAATDAVNSSKITDKDGNVILSVDTVNNRVGIGTDAPTSNLNVLSSSGGEIRSTYFDGTKTATATFRATTVDARYPRAKYIIDNGASTITNAGLFIQPGENAKNIFIGIQDADESYVGNKQMFMFINTSANNAILTTLLDDNDNVNSPKITLSPGDYDASGGGNLVLLPDANKTSYFNGIVGIKTTAPNKQLEINSADGNCLRLTYNDANGSATYYADFNVSAAGLLTINASGGIINTANDIEITDATKGIILKSPDGSRWRVTVDNSGNLITTSI